MPSATRYLISGGAGLALLFVSSLPVAAQTTGDSSAVVRMATPSFQKNAALFYPERAQRLNVAGQAVIECELQPNGELSACGIVSSSPDDQNFGDAALALAKRKAMTVKPSADAPPTTVERVRVTVHFRWPKVW